MQRKMCVCAGACLDMCMHTYAYGNNMNMKTNICEYGHIEVEICM